MFDVQFITHFTDTITYLDSVRIALEGGCRWIQLRMKGATDAETEPVAREALRLCRELLGEFPEDSRGKRLALELESVLARTDLTELAGHLGGVLEGNRRMTRIIKSLKKSVDRPRLMRYALGQDVLELEDGSQQQDTAVTRP